MIRMKSITLLAAWLAVAVPSTASAQSQAANGNIEGMVRDASGAVIPGVTVTVTNVNTGTSRVVVTNNNGLYRALALPLGTYSLVAELQGFRKFEQTALPLAAGQSLVLDINLSVGGVTESVVVSGATPVVDTGKIDAGRNLSEREIKNLPLVSRNPYNFALVQPGVSGFENPEFGVPRFSANGTLLQGQLSDRREYQYGKGPRRPAAASGVGSHGAGSEGRHQRLRAGVRTDDGTGL